ncbi:MAG: minJ [Firmicutes bacterium]|nr:minJ [Bacillota bacterium]
MFPWQEIIQLIVRGMFAVFFESFFWMILALVGYQYWQLRKTQERMFGVYGHSLVRQIVIAALYGVMGGLLASLLTTVVGVTLNQLGLSYIWPVALLLMLINMRFLCFAYAGGLIAVSNVLFGWPEVNVPQVLSLVAILHITESFLIAVSGRSSAAPLILKRPDGRVVGAFSLQNFWPLPLVLLAAVSVPLGEFEQGMLSMPDWWPLLPSGVTPAAGEELLHLMFPVVAALGYSDMAISSRPVERRRRSALHLAAYSATLLVLALLSAKFTWLQIAAALLSPLGHEFLIQMDNRREMGGKPFFVPPAQGVMVLETVHNSVAQRAGVRSGDILLSIEEHPVNTNLDLGTALYYAPARFILTFQRDSKLMHVEIEFMEGKRQLGVIPVPQGDEPVFVELAGDRFGLVDWLKTKFRRR